MISHDDEQQNNIFVHNNNNNNTNIENQDRISNINQDSQSGNGSTLIKRSSATAANANSNTNTNTNIAVPNNLNSNSVISHPNESLSSTLFPDSDNSDQDEQPLLTREWQTRAAAAVLRYHDHGRHISNQSPTQWLSLSFIDLNAERAFRYFFSSLNEHKLRRRLLLLNFFYMVYATVEWGTRSNGAYTVKQQSAMTVCRALYILINMMVFTYSFTSRGTYRR